MLTRSKQIAIVAAAGTVSAVAAFLVGAWLGGAFDDPDVDGEFVLVEPGIYEEPPGDANESTAGRLVPATPLLDTDDQTVYLDAFGGEPMVVNVWFSNCVPCAQELADFAEVHAERGDEVQFVGVNPFDTLDTMVSFAAERGVGYELLRDVEFGFVNDLGLVAYPVTLFVDGDGRIVEQTGVIDADGLRAKIDELL